MILGWLCMGMGALLQSRHRKCKEAISCAEMGIGAKGAPRDDKGWLPESVKRQCNNPEDVAGATSFLQHFDRIAQLE